MAVEKQVTTLEEFIEFVHRPENADRLFEFIDGEIIEKGEFIHGEIVEKIPGRATNSAIHTLDGGGVLPGFTLPVRDIFTL